MFIFLHRKCDILPPQAGQVTWHSTRARKQVPLPVVQPQTKQNQISITMKKTLITLLALCGVAAGETTEEFTYNVALDSESYDGYKSKGDATGWVQLDWGQFSASNLQTDFALLGITSEGNYGFNHVGNTENTQYGFGVGHTDGTLTLIGRNGVGQQTLFASVVDVSSVLGTYTTDQLLSLSVTTTVTNGTDSDSWWGLYKMDSEGSITVFSSLCDDSTGSHNMLTGKTTETITLTADNLSTIQSTDKLIVLYRQGAGGKSLGINSLSYNGTVMVPEPTTATLSLLALAGLAARRRRK